MVFFETPNRIIACLDDIIFQFGLERQIVVCRELTKKFETIYRGSAEEVKEQLNEDTLKGEIVLLVSPAVTEKSNIDEIGESLFCAQNNSLKESVQIVAGNFNVSKNTVYQTALKLKKIN